MKQPTCIAVVGVPISGKTTFGTALAEATGFHFVDYEVAKRLSWARIGDPSTDLDGERARMRPIYAAVHAAVEATLTSGRTIIVALPYTKPQSWGFLKDAIMRGGGVLKIILCSSDFSDEEMIRRMAGHVDDDGAITLAYWHLKKSQFQEPELPHITVRMEGGDEGTRAAVEAAIKYINE